MPLSVRIREHVLTADRKKEIHLLINDYRTTAALIQSASQINRFPNFRISPKICKHNF